MRVLFNWMAAPCGLAMTVVCFCQKYKNRHDEGALATVAIQK